MKRITTTLALAALYGVTVAALAASPLVAAGVPQVINYQGRLTDPAGNNVNDGVYTIAFRISDAPAGGILLWSETLPVQVTDGLLTTQLGTISAIPADLFSGGADRYLGVAVNPDPEMPRVALSSVAYAYQAKDADVATLAQDLNCVGCVSAGEIAAGAVVGGLGGAILDGSITSLDLGTNSVNSDEIAFSAVGTDEIATGGVDFLEIATDAVRSAEVLDNSLTAVDIDDEPGVASNTSSFSVNLGPIGALLSRSITAPAEGYVFAIATAEVLISHTNGSGSSASFGVSPNSSAAPDNQTVRCQIDSDAPTGTYRQAVTVHGLFYTPGGSASFYFLGTENSGDAVADELQFTLIYFPTAHGTVVSTAAPSSGERTSDRSDETGSGLSDTGSDPVQTQVAHSAGIQQDQARKMADMEARIKQLEDLLRQSQLGIGERRKE